MSFCLYSFLVLGSFVIVFGSSIFFCFMFLGDIGRVVVWFSSVR